MRTHFLHGIRQKLFPALSWKIAATAGRTIIVGVLFACVGTAQRVQREAASNLVTNAGTAAKRGRAVVAAGVLHLSVAHVL